MHYFLTGNIAAHRYSEVAYACITTPDNHSLCTISSQVTSLHTEMVKWMVHVLLRLAPDKEGHSEEAKQAVLMGSAPIAQIQANAKSLFERLISFSKYVIQ